MLDTENTVSYNSFYNLLVVVPHSKDCYETVAILNYFGFPYAVEQEMSFNGITAKEFGYKSAADVTWPLLVINSSSPEMPDGQYESKQEIIRFLVQNRLIMDPRSHSAYENQGLAFLENELEPALDDLMRCFV